MVSIGILVTLIAVSVCGPASSFAGVRSQFITNHHLAGTTRLRSFSDDSSEGEELDKSFISSIEKLVNDGSRTLILTTARKQRMQKEIGLLRRLDPSHPENIELQASGLSELGVQEYVTSQLWDLWYSERGEANKQTLMTIDKGLGNRQMWEAIELRYRELIDEHCGQEDDVRVWTEPANRLATLLFLMGRHAESKTWCERILESKPWHTGALSGVVMVCTKMNDLEGARAYGELCLPPTSEISERKKWIERNVDIAEARLAALEKEKAEVLRKNDDAGDSGTAWQ